MAWGYWHGCYSPQNGLGVLAWMLQLTGDTGLAATVPRVARMYRPGCYRAQADLGVQAWLLQPTGGTGLAATAHRGYWPGC